MKSFLTTELFFNYIGLQVLVVSWTRLFYSEGVFEVDITHFCYSDSATGGTTKLLKI